MISNNALLLIVKSDLRLFEHHLKQAGMRLIGRKTRDPLLNSLTAEDIAGIASQLNYDIDDPVDYTSYQRQLIAIAERAGFVVGLNEGLDQMPGSWSNPVRNMLRAKEEPEPEQAPAPDQGEAAEQDEQPAEEMPQ